jgi:hypothetical protein
VSGNYIQGYKVTDFLQSNATGKNAGQSLKAVCGELAARALLARFVLRNAATSTGGCKATYKDVQTLSRADLFVCIAALNHQRNITSTPGRCGHGCGIGVSECRLMFAMAWRCRPLRTRMCRWGGGRRLKVDVRDGMAVQAVADTDVQLVA